MSEDHTESAIDDASVERRPGIDGPPAVGASDGQEEGLVACLAHVEDVLGVHKDTDLAEATLAEQARQDIGPARPQGRFVLEPLPADVVNLDPKASPPFSFPERVERPRVTRR